MGIEYAYAGSIVKSVPQSDGSLMVYGMVSDPSVDLDGQSCDPEWLKTAVPTWFKTAANVREQHGPVAAGVGKELTHADGDKWMLKAHVVDANTVRKVEAGVLKGFSIGVRNGKVQRGKSANAPNGVIVGGDIVEVSLVDRPCNPYAMATIVKSVDGGDLEAVQAELIDIDPSFYGESAVPSDDDDADGQSGSDEGAADSGGPAGGDDDPGSGDLTLFGDWDDDAAAAATADVDKAWSLLDDVAEGDDDAEVTISKGLLESLLNGPGRDADGDGKTGEGRERKRRSDEARRNREHREREAERERRHRGKVDAEALQDANNAQRQGRRQEADEHRGRLGSYRKALTLREYRAGVKLVDLVNSGVITKGAAQMQGEAEEIIAELAELIAMEADQLASGGYEGPEDVSLLVDAVTAIAKMAGGELTIRKGAGLAVDESTASGTLDVAEIVKAQVAEQLSIVREAHEAEVATLRAQVTKMAATPLPGGPFVGRMAMPSTPAQTPALVKAVELERRAADPSLSSEVATGLLALAAAERAKG